ncbi:2Fe-2S iron-sulfur cluster-binding protein [Streptomyces sp. A3M-1-3]|uniref:2Fe-2S iron-sulfur cluster-binding protein n=1 Tax=Streptomyces sp. A3M-1-3 TaxID=2962044 RepID=UPI0020B8F4FA|nr:2Fe-2S iron-sulfur cluster-binding protein [Streptomyces sp. A3M-1-3]MCP3818824.1 2Fe-2S iron-sulfur cluster-binding protein [Streptomyces sp. A3M-1-3]
MDPQLWWHLARVGGLMSWWLLSATVLWGLLMSTRVLGPRAAPARLYDLHRFLSGLSLAFLTVHLLALLADSWVDIGLLQLLVPFTSDYRPAAVAWGVTALYLLAAVEVTSLLKDRIPHRWWRYVHGSTFALFVLTTVHALTAGTDATAVWWTGLALAAAVGFLTVYRLLAGRHAGGNFTPATTRTAVQTPVRRDLPGSRPVIVKDTRRAADGVVTLDLAAPDGTPLPPWEPGAHVDLILPSGTIRQYSLCGDPADRDTYRVGVLDLPDGRGGSAEVHALEEDQHAAIRGPRNKFPLVLADHYLFIAGGIGITPILPMVRAVAAAGREWHLLYGGRSRATMAFADELAALGGDRVRLVPQDSDGLPDLAAALAETPPGAAVYACGPEPLIRAAEKTVAADFSDRHLHIERFSAPGNAPQQAGRPAPAREFQVELRRSGRVLPVPADRTLLEVIREATPGAASSCEEGFCGTCELRVLDGTPDHRDTVLPAGERDRRDIIYPCVSRSRTPRLVVDL